MTISFLVTRVSQGLVGPCEPTPAGKLPLSWIDRYPTYRFLLDSLHVFRHGQEPAKVLKEALSKVLVHYYPLAGRLVGELEVDCTGDGVWFVEASVNCSLGDACYLEYPLKVSSSELLPSPCDDAKSNDAIIKMQVTQFTCGGFVIGLRFHHAVLDGLGAAQFLHAVADIAKGLAQPIIKPIWCREAFPNPASLLPGTIPPQPNFKLERSILDIPLEHITELKNQFFKVTDRECSTFDVVIATTWQSRTRAIELEPGADVHLSFTANARRLLHKLLPPENGYYGNCVYPLTITAPSAMIVHASIAEIVSLIKDAKEKLPTEFSKWTSGDLAEDPFQISSNYNTLYVSDWTRVGFSEVDYGWGAPIYAGPVTYSSYTSLCILAKPPVPNNGARLIAHCVREEHLPAFKDQMTSFTQPRINAANMEPEMSPIS